MEDEKVRPERTVATARARSASASGLTSALASRLSSPFWLAVLVVALVASSGIVATATSHRTLKRIGQDRADEAFRTRAAILRVELGDALAVSDPLLDRLETLVAAHPTSPSVEPLLMSMGELATSRRGLTWMSASFPDGSFLGVYYEDGKLRGQESRIIAGAGVERTYALGADGRFVRVSERPTTYDPRARTFYRDAVSAGARIWTAPYPFLPHLRTGITRAAPVYQKTGADRALVAVLTADFDASGLTKLLGEAPSGERYLVTVGDAVLATSGIAEVPRSQRPTDRPLMISDLSDRVVREASAHIHRETRTVSVAGVPFRHGRELLTSQNGLEIELHAFVDERRLFAQASAQARKGALATSLAALVATVFASLLSRQIAQLRRKRREAERDAEIARAEVAELGTYRLIERIGAGGMGEVWRARHTLLARDAALKLIRAGNDPSDEPSARRRFNEEARVLASMRSIHTVTVHDFGVAADGRYFLVMELLDGVDLETLVKRYGTQPPARVAAILAQACESLAEAHAAGLVHQDIKPANIFLCRLAESLDVVKVLDFGLTRAVGRGRTDGRTEGTPAFMAPEQARGEPVVAATDLYAIGCVGFFLLTGRLPYLVDTERDHMLAHVHEPVPELPSDLKASLPPALTQLLTRCLAKRPDHRPTSASGLALALREVERRSHATFDDDALRAFWAAIPPLAQKPPEAAPSTTEEEAPTVVTRQVRRTPEPR